MDAFVPTMESQLLSLRLVINVHTKNKKIKMQKHFNETHLLYFTRLKVSFKSNKEKEKLIAPGQSTYSVEIRKG